MIATFRSKFLQALLCAGLLAQLVVPVHAAGGWEKTVFLASTSSSTLAVPNQWAALGTGLNSQIVDIAVSSTGDVYPAGVFSNAGGYAMADFIAKWNGTSWSALGTTALNGSLHAVEISDTDEVYIGGVFTNAGGNAYADYIAKWNGTSWSALGTIPLTNDVYSIAIHGDEVYAGGFFLNAGGDPNADRIAKWDGTSWSALGAPLSANVFSIAVNEATGDVYAGGGFVNAGGDPNADRIAKWDGTSWSALGTAPLNASVWTVAIDEATGDVYAGGDFTNAGGDPNADYIAKWDGTNWSALGIPPSTPLLYALYVRDIEIRGTEVYAGFVTGGGGESAMFIGKWDGVAWSDPGATQLTYNVRAVAIHGTNLYVGGDFKDAGGDPNGDYIAKLELPTLSDTIVLNTNDGGAGSLRQAIANAVSGDTITFHPSLAGGWIGLSSQLLINKNLTIDGSGLNPPLTLTAGLVTRIMQVDYPAQVTILGLTLTSGVATSGNGGAVYNTGEFTAIDSSFLDNGAWNGGAIWGGTIRVINSTFSRNHAYGDGGAIIGVNLDIRNSTFHSNEANHDGGAISIYGDGASTIVNSTIFQNRAGNSGGGMFMTGYPIVNVLNSTFAENTAVNGHEFALGNTYQVVFANTVFVCNAPSDDCYVPAGNTISNLNSILGIGILHDHGLAELADNGGSTETMALLPDSPLIDAGDDSACANAPVNNLDQRGVARPQGSHCDMGAYEYDGLDSVVDVIIGTSEVDSYVLSPHETQRKSYPGMNGGPVKITNTHGVSIMAAERVIYKVNNIPTSFSEMMALPDGQLDNIYWLPWYNNKDLDTQLRIANVSATDATVHVTIGGVEMTGSPYTLAPGASRRLSYVGIDNGPVKIESNVNIVAAERVIYKVNGVNTSFSEMMALPNKQLDTIYWLPWYNNKDLNTQLRIANVSPTEATVHVTIGGVEMTGSPYTLAPGASRRLSFPGIDKGPVKIDSDVDIVAAERVIYKVNGVDTSFAEMMAQPNSLLNNIYWLPWYNNKDLNTQLRIANVSAMEATVHVTIGGVEMTGSPYTLTPGASRRLSFVGIDKGPVKIESNVNIVAAERVIYKVNNVDTSFSEMMALPNSLLDITYWLPWYNNVELDTQLRFGVP